MPDQEFLIDDFFSPKDAPGIPSTIEVRGRSLPIRLRIMNFGEVRALMSNNVRVTLDEAGKPQIEMVQNPDRDGNTEMVLACLKEWPFRNPDGSMLEINQQHLDEMHPDVMAALLQRVSEFAQKTIQSQQEGIQGPFGKP
jgi:hypothetical protein